LELITLSLTAIRLFHLEIKSPIVDILQMNRVSPWMGSVTACHRD